MPRAKTKALTSADDVRVNVSEPKAKPTAKPSGILWTVILNINNKLLHSSYLFFLNNPLKMRSKPAFLHQFQWKYADCPESLAYSSV